MATARRRDNSSDPSDGQAESGGNGHDSIDGMIPWRHRSLALNRSRDVRLLTLYEVCRYWAVSDYAVRKAVLEGRLQRVRRPGHQPYFLGTEVIARFGQPTILLAEIAEDDEAIKRRKSAKGPQLTFPEFELAA